MYVGINEDKESQLQVLKAILRKWVTLWVTHNAIFGVLFKLKKWQQIDFALQMLCINKEYDYML